ncbi:MAG TPA: hypothetical protein VGO96_21030 [Pyrinomonadaceae bacterium]|nr:hypothetical protein [Pyrinomonadaceae bacterium]
MSVPRGYFKLWRDDSNTDAHPDPDANIYADAVPDAARQHAAEPHLLSLRA